MIARRTFLRDLAKSILWVPVAPAIVSAQNVFSTRRRSTGGASVHLLNGLVSYWEFFNADEIDSNTFSTCSGSIGGSSWATNVSVSEYDGAASGSCGFGGGTSQGIDPSPVSLRPSGGSFSVQLWFNPNGSYSGTSIKLGALGYSGAATQSWWLHSNNGSLSAIELDVWWNSGVNTQTLAIGSANLNVGNHIVWGFDQPNAQIFAYFNNGAKLTASAAAVQDTTLGIYFGTLGWAGGRKGIAYWNRAVNSAEVNALWGGGNGLNLSNFTA